MKTLTINIDERDLTTIVTALSVQPFREVAGTIYKLKEQTEAQNSVKNTEEVKPIIGDEVESKLFDDPDM